MKKLIKKDLNKNIHLSEGNIKSKNTNDILFLTWSLPSRITCPYATEECKKRCFAKKRELNFPKVLASRMRNYEETKKDTFIKDMIEHFEYHLQRKKAQDKTIFVRIHTSGDFYNYEYLLKWHEIAKHFKNNDKILFQAYTKSVNFLDLFNNELGLNNLNIHLVYSIWCDTSKLDILTARNLNLQTFTALPKTEIAVTVEKEGKFLCNGDCGNCRQCYTGKKDVVIQYH